MRASTELEHRNIQKIERVPSVLEELFECIDWLLSARFFGIRTTNLMKYTPDDLLFVRITGY